MTISPSMQIPHLLTAHREFASHMRSSDGWDNRGCRLWGVLQKLLAKFDVDTESDSDPDVLAIHECKGFEWEASEAYCRLAISRVPVRHRSDWFTQLACVHSPSPCSWKAMYWLTALDLTSHPEDLACGDFPPAIWEGTSVFDRDVISSEVRRFCDLVADAAQTLRAIELDVYGNIANRQHAVGAPTLAEAKMLLGQADLQAADGLTPIPRYPFSRNPGTLDMIIVDVDDASAFTNADHDRCRGIIG